MYKYGVAHCCCGCEILHVGNDVTETDFNEHYEANSGSTTPTFGSEEIQSISFTGNSDYDIIFNGASYGSDNIGYFVCPVGMVSRMIYTFKFGEDKTITAIFSMLIDSTDEDGNIVRDENGYPIRVFGEKDKQITTSWDWLEVRDGNYTIFDSLETCAAEKLYTGKIFIVRRQDDEDNDVMEVYAENSTGKDQYIQRIEFSIDTAVNIQWQVMGSSYELDMTNGYNHLWKPDKWWLFSPNEHPDEDSTEDDGAEYEGCEYPVDNCYILGNIPIMYPQLKLWFTGLQDGGMSVMNANGYALGRLNGYEVKGYWRDDCTIRFNNTRWVVGDDVAVSDPDSCPVDGVDADPVALYEIELTAEENEEDDTVIDLALTVYAVSGTPVVDGYEIISNWTLTGTAHKDDAGQLDIERLYDITLQPEDGLSSDNPFFSAVAHLGKSEHEETHNPTTHAFISDNREIESFEVEYQVGFLGFNSNIQRPTEIADFRPLYTNIRFVLEPQEYTNKCPDAPLLWTSPEITINGEYTGLYAMIDARSGWVYLYSDVGSGINALQQVRGNRATSPRHTNQPELSVSDDWGNYSPLNTSMVHVNTGNSWDELRYLAPTSIPGHFYKNADTSWGTLACCRKAFRGDCQIIAIEHMDGEQYAVHLVDGFPESDPNTWQPKAWYGAMPAAIGSIKVNFKNES